MHSLRPLPAGERLSDLPMSELNLSLEGEVGRDREIAAG
ncbi:protein of unknown function [Hyphomicrobium sp. 1Nfss2.1]